MKHDEIRALYASGFSKRDLVSRGYSYTSVKEALVGLTRSASEAARLYGQRRTESRRHVLNQDQLDLIYGSLLGDSSLSSYGPSDPVGGPKYTIMFCNVHCDAQSGYVEYMKYLIPKGNVYTRIQESGYKVGSPIHRFVYRNKGALLDIWSNVMVGRKKTVTDRWAEHLTPSAIAYWFMDDGTSCRKRNGVVVRFSTYSFSISEIDILRNKLSDFGFRTNVQESRHGPVLSLSQSDSFKFMDFVSPTVAKVPCMLYKIKYPTLGPD